jgi:hypothetical protein
MVTVITTNNDKNYTGKKVKSKDLIYFLQLKIVNLKSRL